MTEESLLKKRQAEAAQYLAKESRKGKPVVGAYCCYFPSELVLAMGGVPVGLCGTSNVPVAEAEKILPANTCPLVKSSLGFILTGSCPFFEAADAIVGETTCDAKKKMYELIREQKPFHLMELPQVPDREAALVHWLDEIRRLKAFLEKQFDRKITDEKLEAAIKVLNRRRRLRREIYEYAKTVPPIVTGMEINRLLDVYAAGEDYDRLLEQVLDELKRRKKTGYTAAPADAPRVLLTGCPLSGDGAKTIEEIEDAGGAIVVHEACSGIKPLVDLVEEESGDPIRAIGERYLGLPCSVMTPNDKRLELLEQLIRDYKPDCVIDVILTACHTYNVESFRVKEVVQEKFNLPFLKIETDYSDSDRAQIRVRIETLFELVRG